MEGWQQKKRKGKRESCLFCDPLPAFSVCVCECVVCRSQLALVRCLGAVESWQTKPCWQTVSTATFTSFPFPLILSFVLSHSLLFYFTILFLCPYSLSSLWIRFHILLFFAQTVTLKTHCCILSKLGLLYHQGKQLATTSSDSVKLAGKKSASLSMISHSINLTVS